MKQENIDLQQYTRILAYLKLMESHGMLKQGQPSGSIVLADD